MEIVTRSAVEPALKWTSRGDKHYRIEEAERPEVGTTVVLHLKSEHTRYLDAERLRGIVRRYADFIGFPIYIGGEAEPANAVAAPLEKPLTVLAAT